MPLRLAIAGAAGRMGRALIAAANGANDLIVAAGSERAGASEVGQAIGANATIHGSAAEAAKLADIWIDFTVPAATVAALTALEESGVRGAIIGTTGFDAAGEQAIASAAKRIAIVKSGNFSLGVNMLAALVAEAAKRLSPDWDIEIVEAHHRRKIDAPSGTALLLGEAAASGRGQSLDKLRTAPRDGITGPRAPGTIGMSSIRGGGIIGEHDVIFAAEDEVLKLSHVAFDRALFARGALVAARWAADKPPGLYTMRDVLSL